VSGAFIDVVEVGRNLSIEGDGSRPLDFSFEPSRKSILGLREFFDTHRTGERYSTGEISLTAFARTVIADLAPKGLSILKSMLKDPKNTQELVNLWLLFEKIDIKMDGPLNLGQETLLPDLGSMEPYNRQETIYIVWICMTLLASVLEKRQFFVTRRKYIGLAPAMSQPGDLIVLVGGC
jgi:hypothetical protein